MKRKNSLFMLLGIIMVIVAICFVIFALNNPQASFPWSNMATYGIYIIYAIAAIFFTVKGIQTK